jgi:hypothetical protein
MIERQLYQRIIERIPKGKAIIVLGPRQCGKTTLLKQITKSLSQPFVWFNGDDVADRNQLEQVGTEHLKSLIGNNKIVIIDEAQEIYNIGSTVKLITDYLDDVTPIISGSSAFELSNKMNEPLTGRKFEMNLFPLAFSELTLHTDLRSELLQLENRLVFGSYPEIVTNPENRIENLKELTSSYLYKDVFKYGGINKPNELQKIVQLLAHQIGNEVNFSEIAQSAGTVPHTVDRYIDILEKAFIVFRLPAISRNVRNEIKKAKKIYFFDNGVRNALIGNYNLLNNRTDIGALWENYLVSERMKKNVYSGFYGFTYFWRTKQQQEIDYLEEIDGKISAFEFKWNPEKKARFSKTFTDNYDIEKTELINRNNYYTFLV